MTDLLLKVEGLTAGYKGSPALRGLDLAVGEGEVVALLGSNGAGKTTTLRAISGLVRPMEGRVLFQGLDTRKVPPNALARRGLGHVPEGRGVFFGLTVAEHFRLGYGGLRTDADNAFSYFPQLRARRDNRAGLLSGGEQQMLAMARVLASQPKLLLLDELSLGLAPVIVESLLPVVRRFANETGAGVLIVEQYIQQALEIADRGYVLSHGSKVLEGPAALLAQNRNLLASSYLGDTAVLPA